MASAALNPDLFLARRAAKSDPAAWEEIIRLYGERIFNLCLRFASTPMEAEDLTQEVFLKLYGHLHQYRGEVPLAAWALRLSRNLCIDHYRHHRLRKQSESVSEEALEHVAAAGDVEGDLEDRERRRLVHRTLAEMPEELATVVLLRDLQGWSYEEVSGFLEVPLGTVKSRLNRARRELVSRIEIRLGLAADGPPEQQVSPC
jgi:RNA polymerase sigma-70 factor (ECF subfamily)